MKIIFVPVNDRPECAIALKQAFYLGNHLKASVKGCHIRAHNDSDISFPIGENFANDNELKHPEKNHSAKQLFVKLAENKNFKFIKKQKNKPGALWLEKKGSPDKLFSIFGPVSDMIVVSRPIKKGKTLARQFMMSAILKSAKPVLILPQTETPEIGKTISIAWNQSPQAARAVAAAMPLLLLAKKVNIITSRPENKVGPKAKHLIDYLRSWNIKAKHLVSDGKNDAQALLNGYEKTKSDLLVMGGYSHNRFKQHIFGGVTKYMLTEANIPIFMLYTK